MFIRNLRVLTTWFPAYGLLFETVAVAKSILIYFIVVSLLNECYYNSLWVLYSWQLLYFAQLYLDPIYKSSLHLIKQHYVYSK